MISNPCVPSGGQWDAPQQAGPPTPPPPLLSPFPPSPSDHHHHLPSPQPTPPAIHPSLSRFGYTMLVTGLYSPPHTPPESPNGVEQDSGALRLPQDPALESNVLGRAMQRQPRGTDLWSKSMHWHFGGALQQIWEFHILFFLSWHHQRASPPEEKTTATKPSGKRGLLISTASGTKHDTVNNHSFSGRRPTCYTLQCVTSCCSS